VQLNSNGRITTRYQLNSQERLAIQYARQLGVLIVAASGNNNSAISALGQASQEYDNIVTVGAAEGLSRACYSSYGNGLSIVADASIGGISLGTSIATARVTNAISQIWMANPDLNYRQVQHILQATATNLTVDNWDIETGFGLLNLASAVDLALITPPVANPIYPVAMPLRQRNLVDSETAVYANTQTSTTTFFERPAGFFDDLVDVLEGIADGVIDGVVSIGGVLIDAATFPFKSLGEAIKFITDKTGDGLKAGFSAVGLDGVGEALNFITDRIGEKTQAILERSAQYIEKLPTRIERTASDFFSDNLWNNFGRWLAENLTNSIELSGIPELAETAFDFLKIETRALDNREKALARSVFGDSINLELVRIDAYSGGNLINGKRPFTTLNTINTWGSLSDSTLIHELTHVWQYGQVGAIYIPDALSSQGTDGISGSSTDYPPGVEISGSPGYRYGGFTELEKRINNGQKLSSFNYEQQAKIVEDYYFIRQDDNVDNNKYLPLYAHFVSAQ
jgi:Subtilase family